MVLEAMGSYFFPPVNQHTNTNTETVLELSALAMTATAALSQIPAIQKKALANKLLKATIASTFSLGVFSSLKDGPTNLKTAILGVTMLVGAVKLFDYAQARKVKQPDTEKKEDEPIVTVAKTKEETSTEQAAPDTTVNPPGTPPQSNNKTPTRISFAGTINFNELFELAEKEHQEKSTQKKEKHTAQEEVVPEKEKTTNAQKTLVEAEVEKETTTQTEQEIVEEKKEEETETQTKEEKVEAQEEQRNAQKQPLDVKKEVTLEAKQNEPAEEEAENSVGQEQGSTIPELTDDLQMSEKQSPITTRRKDQSTVVEDQSKEVINPIHKFGQWIVGKGQSTTSTSTTSTSTTTKSVYVPTTPSKTDPFLN